MECRRMLNLPIFGILRTSLRTFSSRYATPLENSRKYRQETLEFSQHRKITTVSSKPITSSPESKSLDNERTGKNVRLIDWIRAARHPSEVVPKLEEVIGYQFKDPNIGWQALQANLKDGMVPVETERLAFLGGNVLRWELVKIWYPTGADVAVCHGDLIKYCSKGPGSSERTGNLGTLATVGVKNGILELMNWNLEYFRGGPVNGWRLNTAIAYAMHAIIGAIFADGGASSIAAVIERLGLLRDVPADAAMTTDGMKTYMNIKRTLKRLPPPDNKLADKFLRKQKKRESIRKVGTKQPKKQPENIETELRRDEEPVSLFFGSSL